jgi:uncharacterized protein (TIGR04141 family)
MPKKPRQEKLVWSLLKADRSRDDLLSPLAGVSEHVVPALTTAESSLFVKSNPPHPPWWVTYLNPHVRGGLSGLFTASSGAVLVVEAADRVFALTFGLGRHLLNADAFEPDFGLRVVLNTVAPDQLKSVDARTIDDTVLHTRRDVSRDSSFSAFGLDPSRELLRAVTGTPRDDALGPRVTGSDALGIFTRLGVSDLPQLGALLMQSYESEVYKDNFDFIDFLRPEKSVARVQELEELLIDSLREEQLADIHLAAPEILDWSDVAGFRFSTQPGGLVLDSDPRITTYLTSLNSDDEISLTTLKSDHLEAIRTSDGYPQGSWSIYRSLVYQTEFDGRLYVLSGGSWFRVNLPFKERVYEDVERLPLLEGLPDGEARTDEAAYNLRAAAALGGLCLDKRFVQDEGPDKIEICDILTREGGFLHVKHRGSSSTLSHLFAQGVNSAERLLDDSGFRRRAREVAKVVDAEFAEVIPAERPRPESHEVSFVVITRSTRETPLTLPFFSLVSLRAAANRLRVLGFPVSVAAVREQDDVA